MLQEMSILSMRRPCSFFREETDPRPKSIVVIAVDVRMKWGRKSKKTIRDAMLFL
jgi:hypothetical protein